VLAVCAGGVVSSAIVPPAPGPLAVAGYLHLSLGLTIGCGVLFGVVPMLGALACARWLDARMPIQPRAAPGASLESLAAFAARPESELPGFGTAIAPVLLPFALIAAASILKIPAVHAPARLAAAALFLGNKTVALLLGAMIAVAVHARQKRIAWRGVGRVLGPPLETAAMIILIVSAGGAYGETIKGAGLGGAVRGLAGSHAINYVLLAWTMAAVMRAAQGSATVAMITAAGIVASVAGSGGFGVHPIYILLAIGFGAKFLSWMNDAGFWVISRISGLTQGETFRSWTVMSSLLGLLGLAEVWVVSTLWPWPHLPF